MVAYPVRQGSDMWLERGRVTERCTNKRGLPAIRVIKEDGRRVMVHNLMNVVIVGYESPVVDEDEARELLEDSEMLGGNGTPPDNIFAQFDRFQIDQTDDTFTKSLLDDEPSEDPDDDEVVTTIEGSIRLTNCEVTIINLF
jgi:hypothetical protein